MRCCLYAAALSACCVIVAPGSALAGSLPAGWTCSGSCGTDGADGDVPLSPLGNPAYEYLTTTGAPMGVGWNPYGSASPTNGSELITNTFSAVTGQNLNYYFDFITSDGGQYADNAWAALYSATSGLPVAELWNITTAQSTYNIGLSTVSWLGSWSGQCFAGGCGTTGWEQVNYTVTANDNYYLAFGVTNSLDELYDTGMAVDGVSIGGQSITVGVVPEPPSWILVGAALVGVFGAGRRAKSL